VNQTFQNTSVFSRLLREWAAVVLGGGILLAAACAGLAAALGLQRALIWLLASGVLLAGQMGLLRNRLHLNHRPNGSLSATLGAANRVTLLRGLLIAGVFGFVFLPTSAANVDTLKWIPGIALILAALLDLVDGWIARKTDTVTPLGQALDTEFDALMILVGAILAVYWGKASGGFILVGLAYYGFRFGCLLRKRWQLPTGRLPSSHLRRPLAGSAMGVAGAVLLPPLSADIGRMLTLAFAVPFLANFVYDYVAVCRSGDRNAPR